MKKSIILLISALFLFFGCSQKRNVKSNIYSSGYVYEVKSISKKESKDRIEKSIHEFKNYLNEYFAAFKEKPQKQIKSTYLSRYNSLSKDKK